MKHTICPECSVSKIMSYKVNVSETISVITNRVHSPSSLTTETATSIQQQQ